MEWHAVWLGFFEFAKSPGLAGTGALVAAGAAYWTSRRQRLWDQWWSRTEWALDKACNPDPTTSTVGLAALSQLVKEKRIASGMKTWLKGAVDQFQPVVDSERSVGLSGTQEDGNDVQDPTEQPTGEEPREG